MQRETCRFGINCKFLKQNKCFNYHPIWQHVEKFGEEPNRSGKKPCYNGPSCQYLKRGNCHFYHPSSHRPKNNISSFTYPIIESLEQILKQIQKAKKEKEERQRQQRQKQRQRQRERELERRRQIERQIQLIRIQKSKKLNPEHFEWYFGKNKSFKAFQVSQQKLVQLDQCIICFQSFTGSDNSEEVKPEMKEKQKFETSSSAQSKDYLKAELTQLYCKHTFHKQCIKKWLLTNQQCPCCRKDFNDHDDYNKWSEQREKLKKSEPVRIYELPRLSLELQYYNSIQTQLQRQIFRQQFAYQYLPEEIDYDYYNQYDEQYDMFQMDMDENW